VLEQLGHPAPIRRARARRQRLPVEPLAVGVEHLRGRGHGRILSEPPDGRLGRTASALSDARGGGSSRNGALSELHSGGHAASRFVVATARPPAGTDPGPSRALRRGAVTLGSLSVNELRSVWTPDWAPSANQGLGAPGVIPTAPKTKGSSCVRQTRTSTSRPGRTSSSNRGSHRPGSHRGSAVGCRNGKPRVSPR
jgi:hypothetical protein